ncbi:MAG TPA: helix-turn-helix domain-containing protein [Clostridiales bacterium]|nr:helix-turn-helix domain-containing protein [Clostridiales bacterium]
MLKPVFANIEKPSKRFYQYLIYYIILLVIIILIISSVVYKYFVSALQREVETSNLSALNKAAETMDMRIKEINNLALMVSKSSVIHDNLQIGDGFSQGECVKEMAKHIASNMFIYDMLLYYKDKNVNISNKVLTTWGAFSPDDMFNYIYQYKEWGKEDFYEIFNKKAIPYMMPVKKVLVNRGEEELLFTYIFPLPIGSNSPQSAAIFLIKASALNNILSDVLKNYDGYIYILNEKSEPIYHLTCGNAEGQPLEILNNINSAFSSSTERINIHGKQFSISKAISDYNRWSYIAVMNSSQLFYKVSVVKEIFTMTVIIVFLLGIIIAFVFASKQYKLLRLLANLVKGKTHQFNTPEITYKDEVKIISQCIEYMSDENNKLSMQLKGNIKKVRNEIILSLLKGENKDKIVENEILDMLGIKLDEGSYVISIVFLIDNYKDYRNRNDCLDEKLLKFSIINVLEELSGRVGQGYGVDLIENGKIALILCIKTDLSCEDIIDGIIKETKSIFETHYDISFTIGVGNVYNNVNMIKNSFMEALRASAYRLIYGRGNLIYFSELKAESNNLFKYTTIHEERLRSAIKQAKLEDTFSVIDQIISSIKNCDMIPELVACIYYGVISSLIKIIDEMGVDMIDSSEYGFDDYMSIESFETIDDLKDALEDLCANICSIIQKKWNEKDEITVKAIVNYIKANYSNSSLSLEEISDTFGISPSFCGKNFKTFTGMTIMKYVDDLRFEKAKELLKDTNYNLQYIIDNTGYVDKVNFIRKFRKKEGVTPIQFRNMYRLSIHENIQNDET